MHALKARLERDFVDALQGSELRHGELTLQIEAGHLRTLCRQLRDDYGFEQLIDLCGVDYALYGASEWETQSATESGFSRAVNAPGSEADVEAGARFAVVYHLLSLVHNQRLRLKVLLNGEMPLVDSVTDIWHCADWYEREAFDLFGILFDGHPDLRRLLTDYGFIGYPFRKDFPLTGHVEMRYDPEQKRVVYEPVSITPRTLVPRVIRDDNRYRGEED